MKTLTGDSKIRQRVRGLGGGGGAGGARVLGQESNRTVVVLQYCS